MLHLWEQHPSRNSFITNAIRWSYLFKWELILTNILCIKHREYTTWSSIPPKDFFFERFLNATILCIQSHVKYVEFSLEPTSLYTIVLNIAIYDIMIIDEYVFIAYN